MSKIRVVFLLSFVLLSQSLFAQSNGGPGVGLWSSLFSYYEVTSLAFDGSTFYCGTSSGLFTYNKEDEEITAYSKTNGMHDVGIVSVAYDAASGYTVIGYENSNIDLFKSGVFYNVPDLMISNVIGDKTIKDIVAANGIAYISTGIGLVNVNIENKEIKETIQFFEGATMGMVNSATISNNTIYVATTTGVYKTHLDNPFIQNSTSWTKVNNDNFKKIQSSGTNIFTSNETGVFVLNGSSSNIIFPETNVLSLSSGKAGAVWVSITNDYNGKGILINSNGTAVDSFIGINNPMSVVDDGVNLWFTGGAPVPLHGGLRLRKTTSTSEAFVPQGPWSNTTFDVWAKNGDMWMAHGSLDQNWTYLQNYWAFEHYSNYQWTNFSQAVGYTSPTGNTSDCIRILKDDQFSGNVYAGYFVGGLYELKPDGSMKNYREGYLEPALLDPTSIRVGDMKLDDRGNLWITNYGANKELKVKTKDGNWYGFHVGANANRTAADLVIDNANQKWYIAPNGGRLAVYNDNGTIENLADDASKVLRTGEGAGNLPDNNTLCIAKDNDGAIWVGTTNGIGIIACPEIVLQNQCEAERRVVEYPGQARAYLFQEQTVRAIAVDGGNRKWIGTTSGLWLISDDGRTLIESFTTQNSPLPSNEIYRINIDPITGDVYISTAKGLVIFRGTATEGGTENEKPLLIYPNPVPIDFSGDIAIRGLVENADVRITDISGQLVYRTQANGGQAVWNGRDYTGKRVQTGVYLVFVVSKDGSKKTTGKIIISE